MMKKKKKNNEDKNTFYENNHTIKGRGTGMSRSVNCNIISQIDMKPIGDACCKKKKSSRISVWNGPNEGHGVLVWSTSKKPRYTINIFFFSSLHFIHSFIFKFSDDSYL